MDKIKKRKFKEPKEYYRNFFFHSLFVIISLAGLYFAFFQSEKYVYQYVNNPSGTAELRFGILVLSIFVHYLGKTGFIVGLSFFFILIVYEFYKEIAAYRRYKRKCKLYHEGLIENIYDIYDDYVPLLSWRRIKTLFQKNARTRRKQYPSEKFMKRRIKKSENYYKKQN